MVEKKYTLQFTEDEIRVLVHKLQHENIELMQRVVDGQERVEIINKLIAVTEEVKKPKEEK